MQGFLGLALLVQVLRHDIGDKRKVGTISEAYPHLIFENFTAQLGQRVKNILRWAALHSTRGWTRMSFLGLVHG
jgi:rRNA maturation protein Rpf1